MAIEHDRILKKYLILCEGKDTERFIITYINSDALKTDPRFGNDIQTFDFKGINDLTVFLKNLKNMEGFETVKQILVIRDAETSVEQANNSVRKSFRECGLSEPESCGKWNTNGYPITAFVLMPSCNDRPVTGALEDLCWQIIADKDAVLLKNDIQLFINQVKELYEDRIITHEHKSRLHTYFSLDDRLVSLKIGEAATAGAFNWQDESLNPLKEMILKGFDV